MLPVITGPALVRGAFDSLRMTLPEYLFSIETVTSFRKIKKIKKINFLINIRIMEIVW